MAWAALGFVQGAVAFESVQFTVAGQDADLRKELRAASLVVAAFDARATSTDDIFGAALADYRTLVETLYANGHYSGIVSIRIDGREAAEIALLNVPNQIGQIAISVDPGRPFRFGRVEIQPTAPGTNPVELPVPGDRARSDSIRNAVNENVDAWREVGHAKAAPVSQQVTADHNTATLSARVGIDPGPRVILGDLVIATPSAVRADRIQRIAGFPSGTVFSPDTLREVATRLRRTGTFSSVSLAEAETLGPGNRMDVALSLADQKPRRFGFGAEISSFEGLGLSGFWLHRNFFGGAERFRFEAAVDNLGGQTAGTDYMLGARLSSPAYFGPDTEAFVLAELEHLDEPGFVSDRVTVGLGAGKIFSEEVEAEIGLSFTYAETDDDLGARDFSFVHVPISGVWDRRDNELDPTAGTYVAANATPFLGFEGTPSGVRAELDARAYRRVGAESGVVLAGRLQVGTLAGVALRQAQPDFLFFSGGGGTVRGQPYQSLDVDLGGGVRTGGRSFLGLSAEIRTQITDRIGAVAFADAGYVGPESFIDGSGEWHSGAGLGLRYKTGLGPIRLDVAAPVSGDTGDGVQLYLGIGQAF